MIYDFYLFDKHCNCLFHAEWNKKTSSSGGAPSSAAAATGGSAATAAATAAAATATVATSPAAAAGQDAKAAALSNQKSETAKLVYGVVFSLRNVVVKLSSAKAVGDGFISYRTNAYKLHYFESLSGLKLVLLTDPGTSNLRESLRQIYSQIYVEYISRNPLCNLTDLITNELFVSSIQKFVRSLPVFD